MKDTSFYIEKANSLTQKLIEHQQLDFVSKMNISLEDTFNEIELLFYDFSETYPALLDMRLMKERSNIWYDHEDRVSNKLITFLSQFKSFIQDYRS
jgi:hypothetical protein